MQGVHNTARRSAEGISGAGRHHLSQRVSAFCIAREGTLPPDQLRPRRSVAQIAGAVLPLYFDRAEPAVADPGRLLRLEHHSLPAILLDTEDGTWQCVDAEIGGRDLCELVAFARGGDLLTAGAVIFSVMRTRRHG